MPGQRCAVTSCVTDYNVLRQFGVTLRFFSLPKDELVRNEWLYRCGKGSNDFSRKDTICSRHFSFSDFDDSVVSKIANCKPKRLNPNAVPSLFLRKRPQKVLKRNIIEYHKILAEEILKEEKQEAANSSEPPIYLEFSQIENLEQDPLCSSSLTKSESSQQFGSPRKVNHVVKTEDCMDFKEELKPFATCNENIAESIKKTFQSRIGFKEFVGCCYICDKYIEESDLGQVSKEDLTKVVQKVLEGIGTGLVIVLKEEDGLCEMCRSLVARIMKLEADLRTTSLGLRALLRLKYSLPPPPQVTGKNEPNVLVKFKNTTSVAENTAAVVQSISSLTPLRKRNSATQTENSIFQRHKLTQTSSIVHTKHKNTQTIDDSSHSIGITCVSNVNEVECLEMGEKLETSSDWCNESVVRMSAAGDNLFEDISNATELTMLLNDDLLVEDNEVVVETAENTVVSEVVNNEPVNTLESVILPILKCARCRFRTKSHKRMKEHMLSYINKEGLHCSICDFSFHQLSCYNKHTAAHTETSQNKRCLFCDAEVHDKLHMRFHIEAKHKPDSFSHRCPMGCPKVYLFAQEMRKHVRIMHKFKKTFKCVKCNSIFNDEIKYNCHVEYRHRDTLNCKYCGKIQLNIEKLISHEERLHRFHRKPKYKCSYCPKKFVRHDLLPRHEMRHTGKFPYRCSDCGYGFYESEPLEKHRKGCMVLMRTVAGAARSNVRNPGHNSSVCDVCGKVILTKYKIHRENHDNPETFQCHLCGKKFRYIVNMNVHIKKFHSDAE